MAPGVAVRVAAAVALALLTASCGEGGQQSATRLKLSACTLESVAARCGQLAVAENRADPNGRKININVAVLPARASNRAPDPLFYLEGGPGGSGTPGPTLPGFQPAPRHRADRPERHRPVERAGLRNASRHID
jgi:hypothetical protein